MRIQILFILLGLFFYAEISPANAQSTAGAYCAAVAGCEVIAVNAPVSSGSGAVEYCRAGKYKVIGFYGTVNTSYGYGMYYFDQYSGVLPSSTMTTLLP